MYRLTTLFLVFFAALLVCTMASPTPPSDDSTDAGGATDAQGDIERRSLLGLIVKAKIKHHLIKGVHDIKHGKKNKDLDKLNKLGQMGKSKMGQMGKSQMGKGGASM
jgi:hypothetical protein